MILVFTLCSNNYLAQAITLGHSLLHFNQDYIFKIGLVDKKNAQIDYSGIPFEIVEVDTIGILYFEEMVFQYNIVELNTSVKPSYFKYFLKNANPDTVIYLDPDIQVFAPLIDLERELVMSDIVITPHFLTPINDNKWQAEEDFLNSGLYNLGFIAIKNSINGVKMLNWWEERLRTKAYIDFKRGLFTDQIWINFVPIFFDRVKIFTHSGYNVAYWNLHERIINLIDGIYYINNDLQLVFYHFASFRPLCPEVISTGQKRFTFEDRPDIVPLFKDYCELLFRNNYKNFLNYPCYYVEIRADAMARSFMNKRKGIPVYKRAIRKVLQGIINRLHIVMDYNSQN
jgi:hypothetical protein